MPSSQHHRPAVSVRPSPTAHTKQQLSRARDLEGKLSHAGKSNDEKVSKLRSHLCEILSDILLVDPLLGNKEDCAGRLWRTCFYAPIGVWRSRISREKRKQGPNLSSMEKSFHRFLKEAITLYDYLITQYQSKLFPSTAPNARSQLQSQSQSQQDGSSVISEPSSGSIEGVLPGLFRFYIHMGDLQRYAQDYTRAENCYLNASKLAPGIGNPYNQLAVVAQVKNANMSCMALYWYTRSIMATHDTFETSSTANLERLFGMNRTYLEEHSRETSPPILPSPPPKKTTSMDIVRAQKAAASKSCLAFFVDLHYELFLLQDDDDGGGNNDKKTEIFNKMNEIAKSMESLLLASAFGDALLCKMVAIGAFSYSYSRNKKKSLAQELAQDFLFVLGSCMAQRLLHVGTKATERSGRSKQIPSLRYLVPFAMLCEFLEQVASDAVAVSTKSSSAPCTMFWESLVDVANIVTLLSKQALGNLQLDKDPPRKLSAEYQHALKEFKMHQGFRPFSFLQQDYAALQDPYVSAEDAVEVLELGLSQTQESSIASSHNSPQDNKLKVLRFLSFCHRYATNASVPFQVSANGDKYELKLEPQPDDSNMMQVDDDYDALAHLEEPSSPMDVAEQQLDDDAGDTVLFQPPTPQVGQASPGSVAACRDENAPSSSTIVRDGKPADQFPPSPLIEQNGAANGSSHEGIPTARFGGPPPGLLPPPGFSNMPPTQALPRTVHSPFYNLHNDSPLARGPTGSNLESAAEHIPPLAGAPPVATEQGQAAPTGLAWMYDPPTAPRTANPFFSPDLSAFSSSATVARLPKEGTIENGVTLLDSDLLESLFMDDNVLQTKNPFVATSQT